MSDLLNLERAHKNRLQIARAHGEKYGAPDPNDPRCPNSSAGRGRSSSRDSARSSRSASPSRSPDPGKKGICYDFQQKKCTREDKCKYLHKPRSQPPEPWKINALHMFWRKGRSKKGHKCMLKHEGLPSTPAGQGCPPSNEPAGAAGVATLAKDNNPRPPSPAAKRRPSRGR